jgi:hypothetical protein
MAITYDKTTLKTSIKTALTSASEKTSDPAKSRDDIAGAIADAVETYIKLVISTATVEHAIGTVVGVAPPGGGAITSGAATNGVIS